MADVTITFDQDEVEQLTIMLSAIVTAQEMQSISGVKTAQKLDGQMDRVRAVTQKIVDASGLDPKMFAPPGEVGKIMESLVQKGEQKSYEVSTEVDEMSVIAEIDKMSPEEASKVFATEYDEPIRALRNTLYEYSTYDDAAFADTLAALTRLQASVMSMPKGLTVAGSMPYVRVSDLLTLGALAFEAYERQDEMIANEAVAYGNP